jgi:hypothetical protein
MLLPRNLAGTQNFSWGGGGLTMRLYIIYI